MIGQVEHPLARDRILLEELIYDLAATGTVVVLVIQLHDVARKLVLAKQRVEFDAFASLQARLVT